MKKNSIFTPIIVLICIGLVASFLLAAVYQVTDPIIEARKVEAQNKALAEVLPEGSGFDQLEDVELVTGCTKVFKAQNDAGYVFATTSKAGYAGEVSMMVGVSAYGKITGLTVITQGETPNLGGMALKDTYLGNYVGLDSTAAIDAVDAYTGATKTTNAIKGNCDAALEQMNSMK